LEILFNKAFQYRHPKEWELNNIQILNLTGFKNLSGLAIQVLEVIKLMVRSFLGRKLKSACI